MGSSFIYSSAHVGLKSVPVRVEADISSGLPRFTIVGLPDAAISESRERIRAAIKNSGLTFPRTRVTVNLAPANLKKQGPMYDLPIALSILIASGAISQTNITKTSVFLGELSLDGEIRPVQGALLAATMCKDRKLDRVVVAPDNAHEASIVKDVSTCTANTLQELVSKLRENSELDCHAHKPSKKPTPKNLIDFSDVRGQDHVKRALEIAAAGNHNMLMVGPPGSGKTMLARAIPSILPSLQFDESLETTKIYSISGLLDETYLLTERPFRHPHHTSSSTALIGGGTWPRPGEVSLAHNGILFMDEFAEFTRKTIENLRQPLEDKCVTIARASGTITFPSNFMLVAAMNPCSCGFLHDPKRPCECTPGQIQKYKRKLSGPILDRIDITINVPRVEFDKLTSNQVSESSKNIKKRITKARQIQLSRYKKLPIATNDQLTTRLLGKFCKLDDSSIVILKKAIDQYQLSARAYTRTLKVARTIADLCASENIEINPLAEALRYRCTRF